MSVLGLLLLPRCPCCVLLFIELQPYSLRSTHRKVQQRNMLVALPGCMSAARRWGRGGALIVCCCYWCTHFGAPSRHTREIRAHALLLLPHSTKIPPTAVTAPGLYVHLRTKPHQQRGRIFLSTAVLCVCHQGQRFLSFIREGRKALCMPACLRAPE